MPVPTISAVTPNLVHTGGKTTIEITGTNFSVTEGVQVLLGTTPALNVAAVTDTRLFVLVPISPIAVTNTTNNGEGSVDVTVTNLDSEGVAVPGETVTLVDGLTYQRVQLAIESDLARFCRQIIKRFKLEIISNVQYTSHTDYDSDVVDLENITDLAKLPGLALLGPAIRENRFYSLNEEPAYTGANNGEFYIKRAPYTVDLSFTMVGVSNSRIETLNMMNVVELFFERNKTLELLRDPSDVNLGSVAYELMIEPGGDLQITGAPNSSNIHTFSGRFVIRGFDLEDLPGFEAQRSNNTALTDDDGVRLTLEQFGDSFIIGRNPPGGTGDC